MNHTNASLFAVLSRDIEISCVSYPLPEDYINEGNSLYNIMQIKRNQ